MTYNKSCTTLNPSLDVCHGIARGLPNDKDTSTKKTQTEGWKEKSKESNAEQTINCYSLHSVAGWPSF